MIVQAQDTHAYSTPVGRRRKFGEVYVCLLLLFVARE